MKPLFIWAGGKTKMIKHISPFLPESVDIYYEPFFGGGAVFIHIMSQYNPSKVYINDSNEGIMSIYLSIRDDVDSFTEVMDKLEGDYIPLSKEDRKVFYYNLRNEHAYDYEKWNSSEESAVLYFLMKTGFNGIWQINKNTNNRFGTPAGLLNQKTNVYDKHNVLEWHEALSKREVYLSSLDYKELDYLDMEGVLIYLDPPYRGCFTSYGVDFDDSEQEYLINMVNGMKDSTVLLSNRDTDDGFFDGVDHIKIPVTYTAGRRKRTEDGFEAKKAVEIMAFNKRP